jgi:multidrug efflux pump subunit AcrB
LVLAAFRAFRPAFVVVLVIPVVLLMTIFSAWLMGYTIDRVSLFALIFSIGILVDDAIVVVENIYRRWLEEKSTNVATAVDAVREVGNPTILATLTVIAALLPMGFVTGMMGPYMEPIPALGSVAMLISLFAAFVFTPYLTISHWLRPSMRYLEVAGEREHKESEKLEGWFRRILIPMIESPAKARMFRLVMWGAFLITCSFFYFKWVAVKMLPLDNKPEFAVVVDMPEGTALPVTANLSHRVAEKIRVLPEVIAVQVYAGTARPFDFNGMVRHYYLRKEPWQAEIQVQLLDKGKRERTSHEIAVETRQMLKKILKGSDARISVVEMPPGPPVLQSVVAEVHGPSPEVRRQAAQDLTNFFTQAESLRDVDNYMRDPYQYWRFSVDTEKSVRRGISVDTINRNLGMALGGSPLGDVKQRAGHEPINIMMQVPLAKRSEITRLGDLPIPSSSGINVPLRELGRFEQVWEDPIIYHKDLRDVEYVVAEVGGKLAAPVYGMMQVQDLLEGNEYVAPDGVGIEAHWLGAPPNDSSSAIEWAGEWTVTFETFRDMGAAFAVALVLIYILVVWEFGNFRIPALIMAPIPLTLLGIIPAHFVFFQMGWGGEFTATSMIGWIALAGIIVRNSILLVDFSIHQIQQGSSVVESVIMACKTRTRPIMITALALVCGSSVIFFDPIFQGMAISLASGVLVSTVLTLIVIPLGCITASKDLLEVAAVTATDGVTPQMEAAPVEEAKTVTSSKPPEERKRKRGSSLLATVWGGLVGLVMLLFYFIRGLFLMLFRSKKSSSREGGGWQVSDNLPPAGSSGSSEGSSGAPPAANQQGGQPEQPPSVAAKPPPRQSAPAVEREVKRETLSTEVEVKEIEAKAEAIQDKSEEVVESVSQALTEEPSEPQQDQEIPKTKAASKSRNRPSTLKKKVVKKKAAAERKVTSSASSTSKKSTSSNSGQQQKTPPGGKTDKGEAVTNVSPFPVKKKSPRRGIRLK